MSYGHTRREYANDLCTSFFYFSLVFGFVLMIVLLSMTVDRVVEQDEYALGYNTYNMEFTQLYEQGKHTIAVGEKWFIVKRTLQELKKDIRCLSKDKVLLDLSVSMQYQYDENEIMDVIFKQFGDDKNYKKMLNNKAFATVVESCLVFNAEEYFLNRSFIDLTMYNNLVANINDKQIGTNIEFLQLTNIGLPVAYNGAISEKQNIEQTITTTLNNRANILTEAETKLFESVRQAEINIINANATANIILNKADSKSQSQLQLWKDRAYGYEYTATNLGLNTSSMIKYIGSDNIIKSKTLFTST
jgi:regulator of protease activity HflC (stomatin/prohibitin superfamily)